MWNQLFEQCNIRSSIFVLPPCLFKILLQLALCRFDIGKDKFSHDYLCIPNWINPSHIMNYIFVFKTTHHMNDRIHLPHICEKFISQTFSFTGSGNQSCNIDHFNGSRNDCRCSHQIGEGLKTGVRYLYHAHIGIDRAKWVIGRLCLAGFCQGVEKGAFAYIGQTYDSSLEHNK